MTSPISAANAERRFDGQVASFGFASGRIFCLRDGISPMSGAALSVEKEFARFDGALASAASELVDLIEMLRDDEAIALVEFQVAMLEDESVTDPVRTSIGDGCDALTAWRRVLDAMVADYRAAEDVHFRGRASDLIDMRDRVLRGIAGVTAQKIPAGCILLADDLSPTRFLETDWTDGGIALTAGSSTSHVAILARAQAVPMLVDVKCAKTQLAGKALLDGERGALIVTPSRQSQAAFREQQAAAIRIAEDESAYLDKPAVTATGERVAVYLNIAGPDDLIGLDPHHCDGVGLVRTELLLSSAAALHDEEVQFRYYKRIREWAGEKPVTIRTLDAGGDKPIPGVTIDGESNPFLGVRGFRLSLRSKDVFKTQLRALLRASAMGPIKIMVPMITLPEEMAAARELLAEAKNELSANGVGTGGCTLGMMVEVPAAAIAIEDFDTDFYSIGSNDLIQYVMAAGRDNANLACLSEGIPKPVKHLMKLVARHGRSVNRETCICGDIAGDPQLVATLLDCGIRALSVAPSALARTKAAVARYGGHGG